MKFNPDILKIIALAAFTIAFVVLIVIVIDCAL